MKNRESITVILDIRNQKVANEISEAVSTLEGFDIRHKQLDLQSSGSYDVLILEIRNDPKVELQLAKSLKERGVVREVFLTSSIKNPEILINAMRSGIKEFFTQPLAHEDVRGALEKVKREKEHAKGDHAVNKGKIINVFGSKGGVGATSIAVNLAAGLTTFEDPPSVVLIDMKPVFSDVATFLDIEDSFSWLDAIKNINRVDPTNLMGILTRHSSGLYVLPSPIEVFGYSVDPNAVTTLLTVMQKMFDLIIVDNGQSYDEMSIEVLKISDTVLLVCELNLSCIINTQRLLNAFQSYGFPADEKIRIVENKAVKHSEISLKDAEESLNKKILFRIPNAYKISMDAISRGTPVCKVSSGSEIGRKYRELAAVFLERGAERKPENKEKRAFSMSSFFS